MSAVLAIVGAAPESVDDSEVRRLLASMAYRGADATAIQRFPGALLAVARDRWEMGDGFAGATLVGSRGPFHLVCDATLYYKADLKARLAASGTVARSDSATDLILAAYEAYGGNCLEYLEGDFAFCLWDSRSRTLFSARDPFGARSLYRMEASGSLFLASTTHPLVMRQGARSAFDPVGVLRRVLHRDGDGTVTAWQGISEIPAAHAFRAVDGRTDLTRYWVARGSDHWTRLSTAEAAPALAHLLGDGIPPVRRWP